MYGLKEKHIKAINSVFSKYPQIEKTILYGSRAKGNYRNGSDIDLTLVGDELDLSTLLKIETELDDLLLPYKIDLSILHKIENQDLVDHINRVGITFYEKMTSEWKEVLLSNHIDLISGYAFKSKNFLENQEEGTLPIIKIKNVANGDVNLENVVYHKYDESLSKFLLTNGDILIAMTGNHPQAQTQVVGDVSKYKLDVNSLLNQRVGKIVPKGETNLDFIYYFFKDKDTHRYLANQSSGSANQANISKTTIIGLKTELPEPPEQKAIAEILTSLDDKIDLLHRQNKTLEAMAETLFREWFVENAEEDWEEVQLGSVIETTSGGTPSRKKMEYYENGIYNWVKSKELNGSFILETEEKITEEALNKSSAKIIPKNSILIAMYGATVGEYAIITQEMTCNQAICALKPNKLYPFTFLFLFIKTMKNEIINMAVGSAQQNISQILIKQLSILSPNEMIIEFDNKVGPMFDKILKNQTQTRTLEKLRDTLLPKLMSGEIKVQMSEHD